MIKGLIKKILRKKGYQIKRIGDTPKYKIYNKYTFNEAFKRCVKRGVKIETVIDVGSSDGRWSERCMKFYPEAQYLLVEAQEGHLEGLRNCKQRYPNLDFVLAAAGKEAGTIYFDNSNLFGGMASEKPQGTNFIEVPVVSLDTEIRKRGLKGPYLLKLDTHGFEIPILEGAKNIIKEAELIIIEAYNFQLTEDSLKFWELCSYMERLGFLPVDLVDLMLRKKDQAFWQMDIFFIPSKTPLFLNNTYDSV
ncbi:MAG: methyltransferase FkbM family protein [Pseudooceanicola sp.]|nr:methyltransferase FkbM family protein [Pseudooceanicola sp.]